MKMYENEIHNVCEGTTGSIILVGTRQCGMSYGITEYTKNTKKQVLFVVSRTLRNIPYGIQSSMSYRQLDKIIDSPEEELIYDEIIIDNFLFTSDEFIDKIIPYCKEKSIRLILACTGSNTKDNTDKIAKYQFQYNLNLFSFYKDYSNSVHILDFDANYYNIEFKLGHE